MTLRRFALAGALAVAAVPASAHAVTDIAVTQRGLDLEVTWSPSGSGMAYVSSDARFADSVIGQPPTTCQGYALSGPPALLSHCQFPFAGPAYVKVAPTGGTPTVVSVPVTWQLAPVATAPAAAVWRNRQTVRCEANAADWSNIDARTAFSGRILVGGAERVSGALKHPVTGDGETFSTPALTYDLRGTDVGHPAVCEVTARNGWLSAVHTTAGTVGRAAPAAMRPERMLSEIKGPKDYIYFTSPKAVSRSAAERRGGALAKAAGHAQYGVSGDLHFTVTVYRTARQAAKGTRARSVCPALRRQTRRSSTRRIPQAVLSCRRAALGPDRDAVQALRYAGGISDVGERVATFQAIGLGSVGVIRYTVSSTWGSGWSARRSSARRAARALRISGASLTAAAARE